MKIKSRLQEKYEKEIMPLMVKEFGLKNRMAAPKPIKVVINMGVGDALKNKELLESLKRDMAAITGQYPSIKPARISIASFNVRIGMPVGLSVTLRKDAMYSFLDRLFSIVLPRLRDFRGVSKKSFDKSGNYTLGISEHTVFPEIDLGKVSPHGLEITVVIKSGDPVKSERLLDLLGMPFERNS